jgi:hypothetical protein
VQSQLSSGSANVNTNLSMTDGDSLQILSYVLPLFYRRMTDAASLPILASYKLLFYLRMTDEASLQILACLCLIPLLTGE